MNIHFMDVLDVAALKNISDVFSFKRYAGSTASFKMKPSGFESVQTTRSQMVHNGGTSRNFNTELLQVNSDTFNRHASGMNR